MKRSHLEGERFDAREISSAAFTASIFAASVGMIWDLATGHVSAFDRLLSNISDDDREVRVNSTAGAARPIAAASDSIAYQAIHSTVRGNSSNA
ncbi:hypothetical protein [Hyphomicrobium sp.]|jgi:hypothetical protein|uniref:hypothetical protein n=1 Tax=Hyphomicrobium sp. TaxID=82 RepID=UPI002B81D622|nr:hypothetical protein [Hyphomicrobium sp.]HVZ04820.1 hypothetical protein [Hyphomicrobium sp.]